MLALAVRDVAEQVVLAGAVVGALAVIYTKGIRPPIRFAQRVERAMSRVEHELGNNGGGTLRDHVDAIASDQRRLAEAHHERHEALAARLSALETHLGLPGTRRRTATKPKAS